MMHAKAGTMGMTQWVAPFLVESQKGIADLTSVDPAENTLAQRQGTKTSLVPPSPPTQTPSQILPLQQYIHMQAPAPPPAPTRQVITTTER